MGKSEGYLDEAEDEKENILEPLVPISIDVTVDGQRYVDNFTWHLWEESMTPELFASTVVRDEDLPRVFEAAIVSSIKEQLASFVVYKPIEQESRQIVRLEVRVGRVMLRDQFEWDINSLTSSPESFAASLCSDLGLETEFIPMIAHSIREQVRSTV